MDVLALPCGTSPTKATDWVSSQRTSYDQQKFGAAPTRGDISKTEKLADWTPDATRYVAAQTDRHDGYGRITESVDVAGAKTVTSYTPVSGQVPTTIRATNALGHTATTVLEPTSGQPLEVTDPNGVKTVSAYDPLGRLSKVWRPGNSTGNDPDLVFEYLVRDDTPSVVTSRKRADHRDFYVVAKKFHDGLLRERETQTEPTNLATDYRVVAETIYDSHGRAWKQRPGYYTSGAVDDTLVTAPDNNIDRMTVTEFDGADRPTASILKAVNVEQWRTSTRYEGDRTHVTPPQGGTATTSIVDARGHTTELWQYRDKVGGEHETTRYEHTPRGELAKVTDSAGNAWTYRYDLRGRKVSTTDPDKGDSQFGYDDAGRLTTTVDAEQRTLFSGYDVLGRKTQVRAKDASGPLLAAWTYDKAADGSALAGALGKQTSATRYDQGNAYTSQATVFDPAGRVAGSRVTIPAAEGALAGSYESATTYTPVGGQLATSTLPAVGGLPAETLRFGYTKEGLPYTLENDQRDQYVASSGYTAYGELTGTRHGPFGNSAVHGRNYDPVTRRLTELNSYRQGKPGNLDRRTYRYDQVGNLTMLANARDDATVNDIQCFAYDHLRRMTRAWTAVKDTCKTPGGRYPYQFSYTYDPTGNRTSETRHGPKGDTTKDVVSTYEYPDPGEPQPHALSSVTSKGPEGERTDSYGYDRTGNTTARKTADGEQSLAWDLEGHLAKVTQAGTDTSYLYDADGNRLIRRSRAGTTLYLGGTELTLAGGKVTGTRYYSLSGSTVIRTTDGKVTYQFADHHGSGTTQIDSATFGYTRRDLLPFGQPRGEDKGWVGEKGFVGGTLDPTGLTQLGARSYDPNTGRFLSVDPVMDPADPQQMNGYAYGNNAPATYSDPDGLRPAPEDCPPKTCSWKIEYGKPVWEYYDDGNWGRTGGVTRYDRYGKWYQHRFGGRGFLQKRTPYIKFERDIDILRIRLMPERFLLPDLGPRYAGPTTAHIVGLGIVIGVLAGPVIAGSGLFAVAVGTGDAVGVMAAMDGLLALTGAEAAGAAAGAAGGGMLARGACFVAGTEVLTENGTTAIERIRAGDKVWAADPETGERRLKRVVQTFSRQWDRLVSVRVGSGEIKATPEHPFWVVGRGWVEAGKLRAGDRVLNSGGRPEVVRQVEGLKVPAGGVRVYNFEVEDLHTYYVLAGQTPVLVHNSNCPNWAANSVKTWGHTFKTHGAGAKNMKALTDRARSTGNQQGQWLDNDDAAEFLKGLHVYGAGPRSVRIPDGLGQVIMPDGSIVPARAATIIPSRNGLYKTGFPIVGPN